MDLDIESSSFPHERVHSHTNHTRTPDEQGPHCIINTWGSLIKEPPDRSL